MPDTVTQAHSYGYMVDLSTVQFADSDQGAQSWIQAMPLGRYSHPFYGDIEFTPERVKNFVRSVEMNVRETELDIDYDHKATTGEAAGWVKQAEARADGLWLLVEWTKSAREKIKEKAYKYFSPEFAEEWKHPKTGAIYKDVLFGGGITNRPFLKDILPLNLSELVKESGGNMVFNINNADGTYTYSDGGNSTTGVIKTSSIKSGTISSIPTQPAHQGGGKKMAHKKFSELSLSEVQGLAKTLGLSEDAPVADVETALNELVGKQKQEGTPGSGSGEGTPAPEELQKKLSEGRLDEGLIADISALVADNPANKVLAEYIERQAQELHDTSKALRFAEAQGRITKLGEMAIQKKLAFPAVVQDDLRELLIDAPKEFGDKVFDLLAKLATTGMVHLGELGRSYRQGSGAAVPNLTIDERAKALIARNPGMSYGDAVEAVTRDDRRLFDNYRADVMELD